MSDLSQLRQLLSAYFNESELRTLAFDLGLDYEMLPGPTKGDKARELILHLWRNGRLVELVKLGQEARPTADWPVLSSESSNPTIAPSGPRLEDNRGAPDNPFTYGNPISDPARFFGRKREVEQVFNRLRNAEGESSSIVGGRRVGKTSLLNYLAQPDVRRQYGMEPDRYSFVYIDLQMVDSQTTPTRLWQRLLTQIARQSPDEELTFKLHQIIAAGSFDNFTLADLFDVVDRRSWHIVLLLDEFENVTANPNFDPSFFYGLRSLAIQNNLSLVTSSQHELIELTHSQAVRSSPFFNIFANINVRLFSDAEAARFPAALLAGTGIEFSSEEIATLLDIAGGHPFFLQAAGHFLFDAHADYADATRRRAAWLKAFREEVGPHMAHYWRTTGDQEQITLFLLALLTRREGGRPYFDAAQLESFYPRAGQSLVWLARQGYVAEEAGRYALFSCSFADWIVAEVRAGDVTPSAGADVGDSAATRLPAARRRALAPALARAGSNYRPLLVDWMEQTGDFAQAISLLQEGMAV